MASTLSAFADFHLLVYIELRPERRFPLTPPLLTSVLLLVASTAFAQGTAAEIPLSPSIPGRAVGSQERPRIASTNRGSLVVWIDGRGGQTIRGTILGERGEVRTPVGITIAERWGAADVTAVGSDYVVAGSQDCREVDLVRVSADGVVSPPVRVHESFSPGCNNTITVASNGSELLIATSSQAALVGLDGQVLTRVSYPSPIYLMAVASDGQDFLLAAVTRDSDASGVIATRVSRKGGAGAWTRLRSENRVSGLAVASDGNQYVLTATGGALQTHVIRADGSVASQPPASFFSPTYFKVSMVWTGDEYLAALTPTESLERWMSTANLSRDGVLTRSPSRLTTASTEHNTQLDLSWSGIGSLMVWGFDNDIWVAPVGGPGGLDATVISFSYQSESDPLIASIPGGFAVVWREYSTERGFRLVARRLDESLKPQGEVVELTAGPSPSSFKVATEGSGLVVAWISSYGSPSPTLFAQRFDFEFRRIDPQPLRLAESVREFQLAASADRVIAIWTAALLNLPRTADLSARFLYAGVASAPSPTFAIVEQAFPEYQPEHSPAVTWTGSSFLVVWAHEQFPQPWWQGPLPPDDLRAIHVSPSGQRLDSKPIDLARLNMPAGEISVASNGTETWVVRTYGRVEARRFDSNLSPLGDAVTLAGPDVGPRAGQIIRADANRFVIAWDARPRNRSEHYIEVRQAEGSSITPFTSLPQRQSLSAGSFSLVSKGSLLAAAYDRKADTPGYDGTSRVFVRAVSESKRRRAVSVPSNAIPFETVHRDQRSGAQAARSAVITTEEQWSQVWDEIGSGRMPKDPIPLVDFSRSTLIYVARGLTADACRHIEIERVEPRGSSLLVVVRDSRLPSTCSCPPVTVFPVHVIAIPRQTENVAIQLEMRPITEGPECRSQ